MEILLYLPCHIFLNYLNVSPTPAVVPLPSSLPMSFSGIMASLQYIYAIPMSPVSITGVTILTHLCFSPEFPWLTGRGS